MARRSRSQVGPLIAVSGLTLLLCLGVVALYIGWDSVTGKAGFSLTGTGYVAMAVGLIAALLLGVGLALLIVHGKRQE